MDERYLNGSLNEQLTMIDNQLKLNDFLAGNHLTGADILCQFMLLALAVSMPNFPKFPNVQAYLGEIENLPNYKKALENGEFDQQEFIYYWQRAW